jgi:hypothetical protein
MAEVRYGAENGRTRQPDFDSSLAFNFAALFLSPLFLHYCSWTAPALWLLPATAAHAAYSVLLHGKLVLQALQPPTEHRPESEFDCLAEVW